jgi:uncharacterized protein CbrC (UPF0167 family)
MALWHRKPKEQAQTDPLEPAPPFPDFQYHPDPRATGSIVASTIPCALCGHAYGYVYVGPVFAADDMVDGPFCPWCIADGSAALRLQVEFTDVRNEEVSADVPGRVLDAIAERTPGFSGHQQEHWLYHCADGAAFIGRTEAAGETAYRFRCRHCGQGLAYSDAP